MLYETAAIECLNFQRSGKFEPSFLLFLPVAVHVAEDDACHVSALHLLSREQQILITRVRQQVLQVLNEFATL